MPTQFLTSTMRYLPGSLPRCFCKSCEHRGPQFRRAFARIGGLRALTKVPFMALTASAPPTVEDKIINSLCLCDPVKVKLDLNQPDIYISTIKGTALAVS